MAREQSLWRLGSVDAGFSYGLGSYLQNQGQGVYRDEATSDQILSGRGAPGPFIRLGTDGDVDIDASNSTAGQIAFSAYSVGHDATIKDLDLFTEHVVLASPLNCMGTERYLVKQTVGETQSITHYTGLLDSFDVEDYNPASVAGGTDQNLYLLFWWTPSATATYKLHLARGVTMACVVWVGLAPDATCIVDEAAGVADIASSSFAGTSGTPLFFSIRLSGSPAAGAWSYTVSLENVTEGSPAALLPCDENVAWTMESGTAAPAGQYFKNVGMLEGARVHISEASEFRLIGPGVAMGGGGAAVEYPAFNNGGAPTASFWIPMRTQNINGNEQDCRLLFVYEP
jgi:hypothetical protein